jgi:CheY-like chemotaxis protein
VGDELSRIADELNAQGMADGDPPRDPLWLPASSVPLASERTERHARSRRGRRHPRHECPVIANPPLVSVVDDDESVRESLPELLRELGFAAEAFASAEEFLASDLVGRTRCLVLDVAMPGMSGPDLQEELARRGRAIPLVFITAQQDESIGPRVLAAGAVACLFKPFSDSAISDAVNAALGVSS